MQILNSDKEEEGKQDRPGRTSDYSVGLDILLEGEERGGVPKQAFPTA